VAWSHPVGGNQMYLLLFFLEHQAFKAVSMPVARLPIEIPILIKKALKIV